MNLNPSPKTRFQTEHKEACDAFRRLVTSDTLRMALDFALLEHQQRAVKHGGISEIQGAVDFVDVLLNLAESAPEFSNRTDTLNLKS